MRDPHQVLGVPWNADPRHIRAAYRKRAAEFHPDRNPSPDAAERLKEVIDAYRFLSNPSAYVQDDDQFQPAPTRAQAATVNTAEFRRQQTFWYHFQRLIAPRRSRLYVAHQTRCKCAMVLAVVLACLFLFAPACGNIRADDTYLDEVTVLGLLLALTVAIVVPHVFADVPLYTKRRGLEPTVPDWLVESYGWIGMLGIAVMIFVGENFFQ